MNQLHKFLLLFAVVCPLVFSPICRAKVPITLADVMRQHQETERSRKEVEKELQEYKKEKKIYETEEKIEDAEEKARKEASAKVRAEFERKLEAEREKTRQLKEELRRREEEIKAREAAAAITTEPPIKEPPVEEPEEEPEEKPVIEPAPLPTPQPVVPSVIPTPPPRPPVRYQAPPSRLSFGVKPSAASPLESGLTEKQQEELGVAEPTEVEVEEPAEPTEPTEPTTVPGYEPTTPIVTPGIPVAPIVTPVVTPTDTEPMVNEIQKQLNEIKEQTTITANTLALLTNLAPQINKIYAGDFVQLVVAKIERVQPAARKKALWKKPIATLLAACKANKLVFKNKEIKELYAEYGPFNFATSIKAAIKGLKKTKTPVGTLKIVIANLTEMLPEMTAENTKKKDAKKFVAALLKIFKNYGSIRGVKTEFIKLFKAAKTHAVVGTLPAELDIFVAQLKVNIVFAPDFLKIKKIKIKPWPRAAIAKLTILNNLLDKLKKIPTGQAAFTTRESKQIYLMLIGKGSVYKQAGKLAPAPNLYKQLAKLITKALAFEQVKAIGAKYIKRLADIAKQLATGIFVQAELLAIKKKPVSEQLTGLTKLVSNPKIITNKNDAIRFIKALRALSKKIEALLKKTVDLKLKRGFKTLAAYAKQHQFLKKYQKRIASDVARLTAGAKKKLEAAQKNLKTIEGKLKKLETKLATNKSTISSLTSKKTKKGKQKDPKKLRKAKAFVNTGYQKDKTKLETEKRKFQQQETAAKKELEIR